ncbi:MAG: glutamate racemase [Leptospirales bacterium]|nr:glutamate racemase [Leptospirales bacterium]
MLRLVSMAMPDSRPIGVFDSGMGGLTVLSELVQKLPNETFLYLGDTARVPYGSRSPRTVRRYSLEIASFLEQHDIKMLVVACNTATAHALPQLTERMKVPVIGVIEPGVRALLSSTRSRKVGVIGTRSTIKSAAYETEIQKLDPGVTVVSQACPLFVPIVEEGWMNKDFTRLAIREYLAPLRDQGVDAVVLGCTHYPLIRAAIQQEFPGFSLIDSSIEMAGAVSASVRATGIEAAGSGSVKILVTDVTEQLSSLQNLFFPHPVSGVEEILLPELSTTP